MGTGDQDASLRVLVNAVSIKEGGPKTVFMRLLSAMRAARPEIEWVVAGHPACSPARNKLSLPIWHEVSWIDQSPFHVPGWYELALPLVIRRYRPDVVFSLTNYLSRRRLSCPSVLLIQHAGHFSDDFDRLTRKSLGYGLQRFYWEQKRRWVHRSAEMATHLLVQTGALADNISNLTARSRDRIAVIPHGPGLVDQRPSPVFRPKPDLFRIGYVTKWGVQKNFETLFRAAWKLNASGYRFRIVLTLDTANKATQACLNLAQTLGIADLIENRGEVGQDEIASLYDSLDMFAFLSLCESFGFPIVEAMARGLPIVVAGTPENREVSRGAALVFPPLDASALAEQLRRLMDDDREHAARASLALDAGKSYSWQEAAKQTLGTLDSVACQLA